MAYFWNILCPSGSEHGERKYREANKKNSFGFIFYKGKNGQAHPKPANPQLAAEIALFSQLWGTTIHDTIHPE